MTAKVRRADNTSMTSWTSRSREAYGRATVCSQSRVNSMEPMLTSSCLWRALHSVRLSRIGFKLKVQIQSQLNGRSANDAIVEPELKLSCQHRLFEGTVWCHSRSLRPVALQSGRLRRRLPVRLPTTRAPSPSIACAISQRRTTERSPVSIVLISHVPIS